MADRWRPSVVVDRMRFWMIAVLVVLSSGCYDSRQLLPDGAVASSGDAGPLADARQFCTDRSFWECRRDQFAGRVGNEEFNACVESVSARCEGFAWPAGCTPTQADADACITILQNAELAALTTAELYATYTECNFCP